MAARQRFYVRSARDQFFAIPFICMVNCLISIPDALASVNAHRTHDLTNITSTAVANGGSGYTGANLVIVPELIPPVGGNSGAVTWTTSRMLKEVGKQAVDQPGHFLIGAAPIWASRCLAGVPWFGWATAPILAYREWLQWPSKRWWDPPLDWAFLTLGAVTATWSRRRAQRRAGGLVAIRQSVASGLAVRGRMRHAG